MSAKKQSRRNLLRISFLQLEFMLQIVRAKAGRAEEGSFRKDCHCYAKEVARFMCAATGVCTCTQCVIKNLRCTVLFMQPATYLIPTFNKIVTVVNCSFK